MVGVCNDLSKWIFISPTRQTNPGRLFTCKQRRKTVSRIEMVTSVDTIHCRDLTTIGRKKLNPVLFEENLTIKQSLRRKGCPNQFQKQDVGKNVTAMKIHENKAWINASHCGNQHVMKLGHSNQLCADSKMICGICKCMKIALVQS